MVPGGIKQTQRLPFVGHAGPVEVWVARSKQRFVAVLAERRGLHFRRRDIDDDDLSIDLLQRLPYQGGILGIDEQNFGASMHQRESDIRGIETGIQRIEHRAEHRHSKMRFDHFRNVRCNDRNRIEALDPQPRQCGCEPDAAIKQLRVGIAARAVDDGNLSGKRAGRTGQEADRRQRYVVGRMPVQIRLEGVFIVFIHRITHASLKLANTRELKVWKPRDRHRRRSRCRSCRNLLPTRAAEEGLRAPAIRQAAAVEFA